MTNTIVLHHGPVCADGFGAAFAAWLKFGDSASYIPVQYGDPMPEIPDGSTVYVLDFSYPRDVLISLARRSDRVTVLDHHRSAERELEGLGGSVPGLHVHFDLTRSGAVLAWQHFHNGDHVPLLLKYIQDRDLWQWNMPNSRPFSAALSVEPKDFGAWTWLDGMTSRKADFDAFIARGEAILAAQVRHVAALAALAHRVTIGDHDIIPAVNSPLFQSEIGEALLALHPNAPFAAVYSIKDPDTEVWSLRSRGDVDVSKVAKELGGGGHRAAAGFTRIRKV